MRLADHPHLDALCGEYLLGTLRGAARRRFTRALREEPRVDWRLRHWEGLFTPRYSSMIELQPSSAVWKSLDRELGLSRYRAPWLRRLWVWRALAASAIALAAIVIGIKMLKPAGEAAAPPIAQLSSEAHSASVTAALSQDGRTLELRASRPVLAGPAQSYELWLLPADGKVPLSLGVVNTLDARCPLTPAQSERLRQGGKLAVSVEPAGGSPTGAPSGAVIFAGPIRI